MKRILFLLLTLLLVITASTATVTAAKDDKNDTKTTAESCKKDGWKTLVDEDDQPFKNPGQCLKYVKDGGALKQVNDEASTAAKATATDEQPRLKIVDGTKPWDGYLEGTGFAPGEKLTRVTFQSDRETLNLTSPFGTMINADGTFKTERIIYWCSEFNGSGETKGIVTVENSAGETYSQTFEMGAFCGPKE